MLWEKQSKQRARGHGTVCESDGRGRGGGCDRGEATASALTVCARGPGGDTSVHTKPSSPPETGPTLVSLPPSITTRRSTAQPGFLSTHESQGGAAQTTSAHRGPENDVGDYVSDGARSSSSTTLSSSSQSAGSRLAVVIAHF